MCICVYVCFVHNVTNLIVGISEMELKIVVKSHNYSNSLINV